MQTTNYARTVLDRLHAELPELHSDLARLYALLALSRGRQTTLADVHDAWAIWRSTTNPAHNSPIPHRSLIPFEELSAEAQELGRKYLDAIHVAARAYYD